MRPRLSSTFPLQLDRPADLEGFALVSLTGLIPMGTTLVILQGVKSLALLVVPESVADDLAWAAAWGLALGIAWR